MKKKPSLSNIGYLAADSNVDTSATGASRPSRLERPLPAYGAIGSDRLPRKRLSLSPARGNAEPEEQTRALLIENVPTNLTYMALAGFFNVRFPNSSGLMALADICRAPRIHVS